MRRTSLDEWIDRLAISVSHALFKSSIDEGAVEAGRRTRHMGQCQQEATPFVGGPEPPFVSSSV